MGVEGVAFVEWLGSCFIEVKLSAPVLFLGYCMYFYVIRGRFTVSLLYFLFFIEVVFLVLL